MPRPRAPPSPKTRHRPAGAWAAVAMPNASLSISRRTLESLRPWSARRGTGAPNSSTTSMRNAPMGGNVTSLRRAGGTLGVASSGATRGPARAPSAIRPGIAGRQSNAYAPAGSVTASASHCPASSTKCTARSAAARPSCSSTNPCSPAQGTRVSSTRAEGERTSRSTRTTELASPAPRAESAKLPPGSESSVRLSCAATSDRAIDRAGAPACDRHACAWTSIGPAGNSAGRASSTTTVPRAGSGGRAGSAGSVRRATVSAGCGGSAGWAIDSRGGSRGGVRGATVVPWGAGARTR